MDIEFNSYVATPANAIGTIKDLIVRYTQWMIDGAP